MTYVSTEYYLRITAYGKLQVSQKILSAYPVYQTNREDVFEGSFKRLLNATELKEPSGFLRLYAEYRVALESATKVVKKLT